MKELEKKTPIFLVAFFRCCNDLEKIGNLFQAMLSVMPFIPSYDIFYSIYPKL